MEKHINLGSSPTLYVYKKKLQNIVRKKNKTPLIKNTPLGFLNACNNLEFVSYNYESQQWQWVWKWWRSENLNATRVLKQLIEQLYVFKQTSVEMSLKNINAQSNLT